MQKNNAWKPSATFERLKFRADLFKTIRSFFDNRGVMEVETPLLSQGAATDPYLHVISVKLSSFDKTYFLQTSPEFCMKRMLAAGSGPIYQLCKAFRDEECGRYHNPEFTMLEWYQPGFDHHALMGEVDDFLQAVLKSPKATKVSYRDLFEKFLGFNPHQTDVDTLQHCAKQHGIQLDATLAGDDWLDVLMTHCIEPHLGFDAPVMIFDYPASKAALAKIRAEEEPVAERFEVYVQGVELANGYHELTDHNIQRQRLEMDNEIRTTLNLPNIPLDYHLLQALESGLPSSAGVALGIDRLVMLAARAEHIEEVLAFTSAQA